MTATKSQNVASSNKSNKEIIMQAGILYIGILSLPIALRRDMSRSDVRGVAILIGGDETRKNRWIQ